MKRCICMVLALLLTLSVLPGAGRGKVSAGGVPEIKGKFSRVEITEEGLLDFDLVEGADKYGVVVDGASLTIFGGPFELKKNLEAWIDAGQIPNCPKHIVSLRAYDEDSKLLAQWETIYECLSTDPDRRVLGEVEGLVFENGVLHFPQEPGSLPSYRIYVVNELEGAYKALTDPDQQNYSLDDLITVNIIRGNLRQQDSYFIRVSARTSYLDDEPSQWTVLEYKGYRFSIEPFENRAEDVSCDSYMQLKKSSYTYNGKPKKPAGKVFLTAFTEPLKKGKDYKLSYSKNKNVGNATIKIIGQGFYKGTQTQPFSIVQAKQPMKVKALKTRTVKIAKVQKAGDDGYKISAKKVMKITKAKGKLSFEKDYAKSSGSLDVDENTGAVIVKHAAKGTHKIRIKVTAAGTKNYKEGSKYVTVKVKVK